MKTRRNQLAAALLAVVGAGVLVIAATGAASKATVSVAKSGTLGKIIVGSSGLTLYHYTSDHGKVVKCVGGCAAQWPPVVIGKNAKPVAGAGITASKLGTVKRPDGTVQVTYGGYALYRFAGDTKPGQVSGQGLEKAWYAIAPTGALVKAVPSTASASTASSSPGSSSGTTPASTTPSSDGGGGGYDY
jgi:predicted lipoprotein with Yx(FWY)xxD motif